MFHRRLAVAVVAVIGICAAAQSEEKFKTRLAPVAMENGATLWETRPRTIAPDVHHPENGNAFYVFALPETRK